jgi:signal peptidase I
VLAVGAVAVGYRLRRRWLIVTVTGVSMEPTLNDGDKVLVRRVRAARVGRGQLVVLEGNAGSGPVPGLGHGRLIKRVAALPGDPVPDEVAVVLDAAATPPDGRVPAGSLVVLGDNSAASVDSRVLGFFGTDRVIGVVVRAFGPTQRIDT